MRVKQVLIKFAEELGLHEDDTNRLIYVYINNDYLIDSLVDLIQQARETFGDSFNEVFVKGDRELLSVILNPTLGILHQKTHELVLQRNIPTQEISGVGDCSKCPLRKYMENLI
jgi:hypothetical protein